jgi:hypothetical protein
MSSFIAVVAEETYVTFSDKPVFGRLTDATR